MRVMNRLYPLIMFQRKQSLTKFQGNLNTNRTHFYESESPLSTIVIPQSHPLTFNTPCLSQIELCNWSWGIFFLNQSWPWLLQITVPGLQETIRHQTCMNTCDMPTQNGCLRVFVKFVYFCSSHCHLTIFNRIFSRQSYKRFSLQRIHPRMVPVVIFPVKAPECPRGQRRCPLRYPHQTADHSTSSIVFLRIIDRRTCCNAQVSDAPCQCARAMFPGHGMSRS